MLTRTLRDLEENGFVSRRIYAEVPPRVEYTLTPLGHSLVKVLETVRDWCFAHVNELIERHNRNFPAEARLAMDPRTRDFVRINGRPYEREPLDANWILERWPADLAAARRI